MYQAINTICEEVLDAKEKPPTFEEVAAATKFTFGLPFFPSISTLNPEQPSSLTDQNRVVNEVPISSSSSSKTIEASPMKQVHSDSDTNTNPKHARKSVIATALESSPKSRGLLSFGWKKAIKDEKEERDNEEWDELQEIMDNVKHEKRLTEKRKKDKERIDATAQKQRQREKERAITIASGERSPGGTKCKVWFGNSRSVPDQFQYSTDCPYVSE